MDKNFDHNGKAEELEVSGPEAGMQPSSCEPDYARLAAEIIDLNRTTFANVFKIGAKLNVAKADKKRMPHGTFVKWVTKECKIDMRTAQKHMRVDEVLGKKSELVAHLQPTTLYALTAKSAFERAGSGLIARIENGEALDDNAIKDALKKARDEARKAKQPQDEAGGLKLLTFAGTKHWPLDGLQETPTEDALGAERLLGAPENEARPIGNEDAAKEAARVITSYIPPDKRAGLARRIEAAGPGFAEQLVSMCDGNSPAVEEGS